MDIVETVDNTAVISNPLRRKQKESVEKMRTALLSSVAEDGTSARQAMQSISAMMIYHQITRIVNYLDLMDKLEAKMYESILNTIDTASASSPETFAVLLEVQTKLQKNMIESQKLLDPYLEAQDFINAVDLAGSDASATSDSMQIMSPEVRDNLRSNAKKVLELLDNTAGE